jgi:hypothetical protein
MLFAPRIATNAPRTSVHDLITAPHGTPWKTHP